MDKEYCCEHFIRWMQERLGDSPRIRDNGALARLKRADSPEQAPQAWDILLKLNIQPRDFGACLTVGAAFCRRGEAADGKASLGLALASCFDDREQGSMRLRRLLACTDSEELRSILRPLLGFIDSRAKQRLCYARLLDEFIKFDHSNWRESIKLRWTQDFWNIAEQGEESA